MTTAKALARLTRSLTPAECEQYLRGRECFTMTIGDLQLPITPTPAAL